MGPVQVLVLDDVAWLVKMLREQQLLKQTIRISLKTRSVGM